MWETAISAAGKLFSAAIDYKDLLDSKKVMLRAYYFEIQTNLDILESIDLSKLASVKVHSKQVQYAVNSLEMNIAASIFFSGEKTFKKLFSLFSEYIKVDETPETEEKPRQVKKTPLQALLFTLRKTTILQKLSACEGGQDDEIVKPLRLKVRLENLKSHFTALKAFLRELDKKEDFLIKTA